jgi:hypothetical protein
VANQGLQANSDPDVQRARTPRLLAMSLSRVQNRLSARSKAYKPLLTAPYTYRGSVVSIRPKGKGLGRKTVTLPERSFSHTLLEASQRLVLSR